VCCDPSYISGAFFLADTRKITERDVYDASFSFEIFNFQLEKRNNHNE
jgi:hypothetical protein